MNLEKGINQPDIFQPSSVNKHEGSAISSVAWN